MKRVLLVTGLLLVSLLLLVSCGEDKTADALYKDWAKVTFELEGGIYKNSDKPIVHYYKEAGGLVALPGKGNTEKDITAPGVGKELEGWYTVRNETVDGEGNKVVTYENKWDFTTDVLPEDGITLYANWIVPDPGFAYNYEICYRDEGGQVQVLGSYKVDAGKPLDDYQNFAGQVAGYKITGEWKTEDGSAWDVTAGHPGGEADLTIRLFPVLVKEDVVLVSSVDDFLTALEANKDMYFLGDVDFAGAKFDEHVTYTGTVEGNGHSVKNFKLGFKNTRADNVADEDLAPDGERLIQISIFTALDGATLRNVSFTDFTLNITFSNANLAELVVVSPLAMKMSDTTLEGVTVSGTYTIGNLPATFDSENILVKGEALAYYQPAGDTSSADANTSISLTPAAE